MDRKEKRAADRVASKSCLKTIENYLNRSMAPQCWKLSWYFLTSFLVFSPIHRSTPEQVEKYGSINRRFAGIFRLADSFNRKTMIVCWFSDLSSVWSLGIICQCLITQLLKPGVSGKHSTFARSRSHKLRAFQIITSVRVSKKLRARFRISSDLKFKSESSDTFYAWSRTCTHQIISCEKFPMAPSPQSTSRLSKTFLL